MRTIPPILALLVGLGSLLVTTHGLRAAVVDEQALVSLTEAIDDQDNRTLLGVSPDGKLFSSPVTLPRAWTEITGLPGSPGDFVEVLASGETVLAVDSAAQIYRSGDSGVNWNLAATFGTLEGLTGIAVGGAGGDDWVVVGTAAMGFPSDRFVASSDDDGVHWQEGNFQGTAPLDSAGLTAVAYDPFAERWLAVGGDGIDGTAWISADSIDWEPFSAWPGSGPPANLQAVAVGPDRNVLAVGDNGTTVHFSDLAASTPAVQVSTEGVSQNLHAVTFLPSGSFLAGGVGRTQVSVSTDGATVLALPGTADDETIEGYLLPQGESLPLLAGENLTSEPILFVDALLSLGDRAKDAAGNTGNVSVANLGSGTLTLKSISLGHNSSFALEEIIVDGSEENPPFDLAAGEEAEVGILLPTGSLGDFNGVLTVETQAAGTAEASLRGSVVPNPSFTSSFPTSEIVEGRAFTYDITVTDPNYQDEIVLFVSSGSLPPGLELTDNDNGEGTLSGTPDEGSAGSYSFTIKALAPTTGGTAEQLVTATVLTPPSLSLSGDLAFGNVATGTDATKTLTVSNTGEATMVVNAVTSSADPPFAVSPTSFEVAGEGSEEVTVTFSPTATGASSSTITVSTATVGQANEGAEGTGVDDPLATYLFAFGLTGADAAADADPDTDSKENLLEFAFGSDPASASSLPRMVASTVSDGGSSYPALSFQHRQTDSTPTGSPFSFDGITYTVQGSTDLTEWNESVVVANDPSGLPTPETGYEWITFRLENIPLSTSGAKGFLRVEVSQEAGES